MKKVIKSLIVILIMCFVFQYSDTAFAAIIGNTDDAMLVGGGARPIGMGRAFTAIVDDADAPLINPAGLAGLKGPQAMAMFTNLIGDVYYSEFTGSIPSPYGSFGLAYVTTGVNNIPTTPIPSDYYDSLTVLSYASSVGKWLN